MSVKVYETGINATADHVEHFVAHGFTLDAQLIEDISQHVIELFLFI